MVRLYEVAHSRAGDKGNLVTVSLIPYDPELYPHLCEAVSADAVRRHLGDRIVGDVVRHRMDGVRALLFVCVRAPGDTVTVSLHADAHGKTMSSALLEMDVSLDAGSSSRAAGRD